MTQPGAPAGNGRLRAAGPADPPLTALARRALLVTLVVSLAGAGLGVVGIAQGAVTGAQIPLILSCVVFACGSLAALLCRGGPAPQTVATASTVYFMLYLSSGCVIAIAGTANEHLTLFVFLIWFFPLRVFSELVNAPAVGRFLSKALIAAPVAVLAFFAPRLRTIFPIELIFVLVAYCVSYIGFGGMFGIVTRYREDFVAERERAESLKVEAAVLESISDCFISLDADFRAVYLNDAACAEFDLDRTAALGSRLFETVRGFFSAPMVAGLRDAFAQRAATVFEVQNTVGDRWYEMRCFPRPDGLSIYFQNVSARRAAEADIAHLAFYDALTDLPNRVLLRARLETALAAAPQRAGIGALLFIDLDDFKTLNDTLGHDAGDAYLRDVARRLVACVGPEDTLARFGGDEFVVLLEAAGDDHHRAAAKARAVADAVLAQFAAPYRAASVEHSSTAGIGIALFSGPPETVDELLKRADLAMYRAKAQGRNAVCMFDPAMQTSVAARAAMQADLRTALARGEFALHYQPQVDRSERVVGAEALLRWHHPRRGSVAPDEFIALAEESGLIVELGRWVLETACRQLAVWARSAATERLTLAVNVSLRQFAEPDFAAAVLDVVRETRADPFRLKLELTESLAMHNVDDTIAKMTELRRCGIGFSIDDFGTGYASLSHLKRLPLDQFKIDRSFVNDILTDTTDAAIVRTLITLGRSLDLSVIAEGVETRGQREFLEREGCSLYQGYLFSRALPIGEFETFVRLVPTVALGS